MKKYIFSAFVALAAMIFTSCDDKFEATTNGHIQVSTSYVSIPTGGNNTSTTITLTTDDSFTISDANAKNTIPDWLKITPKSGAAGTTEVTFSAAPTEDGRSTENVVIRTANDSLRIFVVQGESKVAEATCAEVLAGPDGKTFRTKGVVTAIANTVYGNFYINDGTGEVYIYGTLYDGKTQNNPIVNNNIEVGDEVTVEGPKKTYNGTVELVDVAVVSVSKSLIKVDSLTVNGAKVTELPIEGGELVANITSKTGNINVEIPAEYESWISIKAITSDKVVLKVAANDGGDRSAKLTFTTEANGKKYTSETSFTQKGAIVACSIAEFLAKEVGNAQFRLYALVTKKDGKNVYVQDFSGSVLLYNPTGVEFNEGDIITVVGKRGAYNGNPQMGSPVVEAVTPVTTISLADFKALEDDATKSILYRISGKVVQPTEQNTKFDIETYGNFSLSDGTTELYVYGVSTGIGGESKKFSTLGVKEGDELTVIAYKTSYTKNDFKLHQAGGAMYVSHKSAE